MMEPEKVVRRNGERNQTAVPERKIRLESNLTAGCGYGRKKQRLLNRFWTIVWPGLEEAGWSKIDGTGDQEGAILFLPKGVLAESGKKGKDYYDKLKDVIERVLEERNEKEMKIAEAYYADVEATEPFVSKRDDDPPARKRTRRAAAGERKRERPSLSLSSPTPSATGTTGIDMSWKDGGIIYPKRSSQIGDQYQATTIPAAGSYSGPSSDSKYCELIWDPRAAEEKGVAGIVANTVPHNKKGDILAPLHANGYSASNLTDMLSNITPMDGSTWTNEEKQKFHSEIFRLRKDMKAVSISMKKDMKACLAYYLGTYKKSNDYRLLKTVCVYERMEKASSSVHGVDACAICGDGGSLLICDGCEGEYHMSCLRPPLKSVPEGHWECDECVDQKFLHSREYLIRHTGLFETFQAGGKRQTAMEVARNSSGADEDQANREDTVFRPSSPVLKGIKSFAIEANRILSGVQSNHQGTIATTTS